MTTGQRDARWEDGLKYVSSHSIRGSVVANYTERIRLFDGDFGTGFKIRGLWVQNQDPQLNRESSIKISKEEMPFDRLWDWADTREIAWARVTAGSPEGGLQSYYDPTSLLVNDCFITSGSEADNAIVMYAVHFDKYEFSTWRGALAMVSQVNQDGSSG